MADAVIAAQQQPMPAVKIVKPVRAPTLAPDTVLCVAEDGASIRICDVDRVLRSETTNVVVGLMPASANCTSTRYPGDTVGWGFCPSSGRIFYNGASRKFCQPVARADTVAVVVHLENGNVEIFRKGVSLGVAFIGVKGRVRFACGLFGTGATVGVCGSAAESKTALVPSGTYHHDSLEWLCFETSESFDTGSVGASFDLSKNSSNVYLVLRNLHKSLFGVIWKAVVYSHSDEKLVGKYVAMKHTIDAIYKHNIETSAEDPLAECDLVRQVARTGEHHHLIPLFDSFSVMDTVYADRVRMPECALSHYAVVEYAEHGNLLNLFEPAKCKQGLGEDKARVLFRQLISALYYMHQTGVAHLDIKPDNLLIRKNDELIIADLGMAQQVAANVLLVEVKPGKFERTLRSDQTPAKPNRMRGRPGTLCYMAPEVFASDVEDDDEKSWDPFLADSWCAGTVLFIMLFGVPPFELPSMSDSRFQYLFTKPTPPAKSTTVSERLNTLLLQWGRQGKAGPLALDLLLRMLAVEEKKRWSLEQVLSHPWLTRLDEEDKETIDKAVGAPRPRKRSRISTPASSPTASPTALEIRPLVVKQQPSAATTVGIS